MSIYSPIVSKERIMRKKIIEFLDKRKLDIFTAALKLADKFGLRGITTKNLAEEIGFREGALYKHIKSKSDIFVMILDISEKLLIEKFKQIKKEKYSSSRSLQEWFYFAVDYLEDFPGIYRIIFTDELYIDDPILFKKFKSIIETLVKNFQKIIEKGIKNGEFRSDIDPYISAIRYLGVIHTSFTLWSVFEERKRKYGEIALPILTEFLTTISKGGMNE